jgi:hypothetical protein
MSAKAIAGFMLLLFSAGFLAVIYIVAGVRLSREEVWIVGGMIAGGLLLIDTADVSALFRAVLDKLPWGRSQP